MQRFDFATGDVQALVERLGRLPDAPMAMPKQRLERPVAGLAGLVARLIGRPRGVAGDARRSGP